MKQFNEPEILVEQLEVEDVITTSVAETDLVMYVNSELLGDNQTDFN
jgi:hypothetical protein